jgi:hypothetical protein
MLLPPCLRHQPFQASAIHPVLHEALKGAVIALFRLRAETTGRELTQRTMIGNAGATVAPTFTDIGAGTFAGITSALHCSSPYAYRTRSILLL